MTFHGICDIYIHPIYFMMKLKILHFNMILIKSIYFLLSDHILIFPPILCLISRQLCVAILKTGLII